MTPYHRILFTTSLFLLATSVTYAAGLVPCGGPTEPMCRVCDFIAMGQKLMTWFIGVAASTTALMFAFGGMKMVMSAGNPGKVSEGKEIMTNSIIGFFILLGAWLIVNTVLMLVMSDGKGVEVWGSVECVENPTMTNTMPSNSGGTATNSGPGGATSAGGGGSGIQCGSLNPACSVNTLTAAGFTPKQADVMSCIAMTESSGNPTAQSKSSSACGTFQVVKSTWESAAKGTSCSSFSSCTDASCNASVAKKLVSQSGYSSWTCANCNAKAKGCIDKYEG